MIKSLKTPTYDKLSRGKTEYVLKTLTDLALLTSSGSAFHNSRASLPRI